MRRKRDMETKRVDLSKLSPEQKAAFVQFYQDCQRFAETRQELQQAARGVFAEFVKAPTWGVSEGPLEGDRPQQDLWRIGAPEVNYVDNIERA